MHGRRMSSSFSWSWTNLLCKFLLACSNSLVLFVNNSLTFCCLSSVHLGVCHAPANCTDHPHPGPCGCPDCSKPHPPHFQDNYCENLSYSSVTTDYSTTTGQNSTETVHTDGEKGAGQNATRMLKLWMLIFGGTAVAAAAGLAMRNRVGYFIV
jgi:hypothetical protein